MTDAFEKWINGMDDDMYEEWLEHEATEAQEEKAINIRTPLTKQEEQDVEREQEYTEPSRPERVYTATSSGYQSNRQLDADSFREEIQEQYEPSQPYIAPQQAPVAYDVTLDNAIQQNQERKRKSIRERFAGLLKRLRRK